MLLDRDFLSLATHHLYSSQMATQKERPFVTTRLRRSTVGVAFAVVVLFTAGGSDLAGAAPAYVTPGAFCKGSDVGRQDYSKNGVLLKCSYADGDIRARWRQSVPK